jgi:multiple sugar transport system permease protein
MAEGSLLAAPTVRAATPRAAQARAEAWAAWLLVLPATVLLWLMLLGPVVAVLALSFTDWTFGAPTIAWVGLENYREMAEDRVFWTTLANTVVYVGLSVPISVGLGLGVALLIEAGTSGVSFYRAAFFLPVVATLLGMALVWEFMFHPTVGLINQTLTALGIPVRNWLKDPATALYALMAIGVWQAVGLNMVLFLAGLKAIPRDLYEAAAIDGADGAWERFRRVTWPMLGPALVFVVTITAIRSFQIFDTVQVITDGGPEKSTSVLLYLIYQEGFQFLRSAYAAALTVVFLAFTLAIILTKVVLLDRRAHYG